MVENPTRGGKPDILLGNHLSGLIESLARKAHERWMNLRLASGWRYGPHRDDGRKEHPDLVPYDDLPEAEKEYDRQTCLETINTLLALGYKIQAPEKASDQSALVTSSSEAVKTLVESVGAGSSDLISLQVVWYARDRDSWCKTPEMYTALGEKVLKLGEPLFAYDVLSEGLTYFPGDPRLRQLLALALARSGAAGSANALLTALYHEGHRDEETLGMLARTYKDLAREEPDPSKASEQLRNSYAFYLQAYQATGGYWSGINAASLAMVLGNRDQSVILANEIRDSCRQSLPRATGGEKYWVLSTLGEAALVRGDWAEAERWYGQAIDAGKGDWGSLQSTRRNARLLLKSVGGNTDRLEHLFQVPAVVMFAGHMIDSPERQQPRFPPQLETAVMDAIRQRLGHLHAGFGFASAACGSDILFHEAILELKGETHVVLPYGKKQFIRDSVDVAGGNWLARCERIMSEAAEVQEASNRTPIERGTWYTYANILLDGLAKIRAQQLDTSVIAMAVWDGKPGNGPGGTAVTVERWRKLGLTVEVIDLAAILQRECPDLRGTGLDTAAETVSAESQFISEIRGLLFADVEGFTNLTDEQTPGFVQHFLGLVGKLATESAHQPIVKNTWGDGLYFVFATVQDAGLFALELRDQVRSTNWAEKGLPALNLRIGLHAGPTFCCTDPVTLRTNYIGSHVSWAARIEPVTPPGQVYASQAFAALAAADHVREFRCDYVGKASLAKKYGTFPTYVVSRR